MRFSSDFANILTENEPLGPRTWFGLGGPARWMARPTGLTQLMELFRRCQQEEVPVYKLGQGANLLVNDDGVDGVVVQLNAPAFRGVDWNADARDPDIVRVSAGGGMDMNRLAREAVRRGFAGLECMGGIPGTLGGIIRMNAGGRFGQIADVVRAVTVVNAAGQLRTLTHEQVGFRYRHTDLGETIVCRATLELKREDPTRLRERFLEIWDYKRKSQPLADYSAGCVFKNPPNESAGGLIDRAGLKGCTVGGASVSTNHANFIVAKEGSTSRDVLSLIGLVRRKVAERFGVELELEIEIWNRRRAKKTLIRTEPRP